MNLDSMVESRSVGMTTSGMFRQIFPPTPWTISIGVKAVTVTSTPKITTIATSLVPADGGQPRRLAERGHSVVDVLADDDGIVDHHPKHQDEGEERDHVDRNPEKRHAENPRRHGDRNPEGNVPGQSRLEEKREHDHHQDEALGPVRKHQAHPPLEKDRVRRSKSATSRQAGSSPGPAARSRAPVRPCAACPPPRCERR